MNCYWCGTELIIGGDIDIEDGMAFVRMWSWYQQTYGEIIQDTVMVGRPLEMIQNDNDLLIILDKQVHAGQIQFSYEIGESPFQFGPRENKNGELFITNQDTEKGYSILEFARTAEGVKDTISLKMKNKIQDFAIFYKLVEMINKLVYLFYFFRKHVIYLMLSFFLH